MEEVYMTCLIRVAMDTGKLYITTRLLEGADPLSMRKEDERAEWAQQI